MGRVDEVTISVSLTGTAGAYSANDVNGGLITFPGAFDANTGKGVLTSVYILDKAATGTNKTLHLFNASVTSIADNAAFDPTDTELLTNYIGAVPITTHDAFADNGVSYADGLAKPVYNLAGSTALYAYLVEDSTPTYASTTDVAVKISITRD